MLALLGYLFATDDTVWNWPHQFTIGSYHIYQTDIALAIFIFFFAITVRRYENGFLFVTLIIPLFLGGTGGQFFWMIDIFLWGLILVFITRSFVKGDLPYFPIRSTLMLMVVAALFSLPLDLKEPLWHMKFGAGADWIKPILRGHGTVYGRYLFEAGKLFTEVFILYIAFVIVRKGGVATCERILRGMLQMALIVSVLSLMIYIFFPRDMDFVYLGMSLRGEINGYLSGLATNPQYLAQYLLVSLPLSFYLLVDNERCRSEKIFALFFIVVLSLALLLTGQRSAFSILLFLIVLSALFYVKVFAGENAKIAAYAVLLSIVCGLLGLVVDRIMFDGYMLNKFSEIGADHRAVLWPTAMEMFFHSPLLGVGLGKFHSMFADYFHIPGESFWQYGRYSGTAHSLYFETLAERGLIGFMLFGSFVYFILRAGHRTMLHDDSRKKRAMIFALFLSIISWLLLGLTHNISFVRTIDLMFWIFAGMLAGLSSGRLVSFKTQSSSVFGFILIVALAHQVVGIWYEPYHKRFEYGYYYNEKQVDGTSARWAKKESVTVLPVGGAKLQIDLSAHFPDIYKKSQSVIVQVGGKSARVLIDDNKWHSLSFDLDPKKERNVLVHITADHFIVPKQAGFSGDTRELAVMVRTFWLPKK